MKEIQSSGSGIEWQKILNIKNFLRRVKNKIRWLYNRKLPEHTHNFLSMVQLLWLVYIGSKPMTVSQKSAMVIAPHQDDEVLGCGGLIGSKSENNIPIQVVFVTDGGASHAWHPNYQSGELIPVRKKEALTALSILGVDPSQIHFLNKPDSKLLFLNPIERQKAIEELAQILQSSQPEEVYVPHRKDRTKDHEATYELVIEAIKLSGIKVDVLQYPIWMLWNSLLFRDLKLEELAGAYRLSIHSFQSKKKQALEVYRSQCLPIEAELAPILKPAFLKRFFLPYEVFFRTDSLQNK